MIQKGKKYVVKNNLVEELTKLNFDETTVEMMAEEYIGKEIEVYDFWMDTNDKQEYVTVDLCVEIPVQCLG